MIDPITQYFGRGAGAHGPVMLMYHSVALGGGRAIWPWAVSLKRFRQQLDLLSSQGWATPTMAELAANPSKFTGRTAVITFDDGYVDNLYAVEELRARNMRATWFIVSGSIGREPGWPADGRPKGRLLNEAELREMQDAGMEIGSHTANHARLTEMDEIGLRTEIESSKATLEDIMGCEVSSFAYPYGAWDGRCVEAVRHAGFRAACTTRTGWALRDDDPLLLRRLTVFNTDTVSTLVRKLYFGSHEVSWGAITRYFINRAVSRLGGHSR